MNAMYKCAHINSTELKCTNICMATLDCLKAKVNC